MMYHLLLASSLFLVVVSIPTTLCVITDKDGDTFDVKIWEWHNSTYGLELAVWRKLKTAGEDLSTLSMHYGENNRVSRLKRAENQVSQTGRGNIWNYLLRFLLPYQPQNNNRGGSQESPNSSSVWWRLLQLIQPSGSRIPTEAQGEVRTTPWSNEEQQGMTWQWPTRQGMWTAWTWHSHNNYSQERRHESRPEGNMIEGGGLRYQDNSGNENGAIWTQDASGTITYHTRVQERSEEHGTRRQSNMRDDGNHSRNERDVRNTFLNHFVSVARNRRDAIKKRNNTLEDPPLGEHTTAKENVKTQARLQSSESKIMHLNELLDVKSENNNSETRSSRNKWLEFVREMLAIIRSSRKTQKSNPRNTRTEEIDF